MGFSLGLLTINLKPMQSFKHNTTHESLAWPITFDISNKPKPKEKPRSGEPRYLRLNPGFF